LWKNANGATVEENRPEKIHYEDWSRIACQKKISGGKV